MTGSWPKIIRDPIHNIVPFEDTDCDRLLLQLINTKEFQRLRRIKQLGLSQLVFPGADHSRFAHSIGVMHVARRFLERVARICPQCLDDEQRTVVLAAALLHDVGHGPFSHAFEKVTSEKHEKRTLEIIANPSTQVNAVLRGYDEKLPERLKMFFGEDFEEEQPDAEIPAYLTQVVTSQLDADRFDYLLRDSFATGTDYGQFDLEWLIQHLHVDSDKGRFYLDHKALFAAEAYVFARYHMYRTVYFHKTTRAAEVMLRLLLRRYKKLIDETADDAEKQQAIVPEAPPTAVRAFRGKIELAEYLLLDDHTLTEFAKACMRCDDQVLSGLAEGLLHRRLFKATDVTEDLSPGVVQFSDKAKELIAAAGYDVEFAFASDAPSDTAYKLYNPDAEKPATQIYIEGAAGGQVEISQRSAAVDQLTKKYTLVRYYYPADTRNQIRAEAEPLLKE
ncbi:MAG: HD domain-containing protein [Pirellulaceae bacterium]